MQEVFEKIIDQLKAESIIVDDDAGNRAVEIIEQTAAEYNNGWIPCSERLPEESGYYCVTTENIETGNRIEQTAWFACKDDSDIDESEWREFYGCERVVAWRQSNPYQPKGE